MSTTRRKFLRAGSLAALFTIVPLKNVLAQSWESSIGHPVNGPGPVSMVGYYSRATFESYLNSIFELYTATGVVEVKLVEVSQMPSATADGECFTLLFCGGGANYRQNTYTLVHPALGTFQLLMVAAGEDAKGAQRYLATINRLSYARTF